MKTFQTFINELKKSTLKNYIKKAQRSSTNNYMKWQYGDPVQSHKGHDKMIKRDAGLQKATNRLSGFYNPKDGKRKQGPSKQYKTEGVDMAEASKAFYKKVGRRAASEYSAPKGSNKRLAAKGVRQMGKKMARGDYDASRKTAEDKIGDAPYYVGWSGQYQEWYGDDDMKSGRYKMKGDGGRMVAINIPDYETAKSIANKIDDQAKRHDFGTHGKDHGIVDYDGAYILPMSKMDSYDKSTMRYDKPRDMSKDKSKTFNWNQVLA